MYLLVQCHFHQSTIEHWDYFVQILNYQGKFQFLDLGYQSNNLQWMHNNQWIVASQDQVHLEKKGNSHQVLRHLATHLDTQLKSRVGKKFIYSNTLS